MHIHWQYGKHVRSTGGVCHGLFHIAHILSFVIVVLHKLFVFSTKLHIGMKKKYGDDRKAKEKSEKWSAMSLKFRFFFLRFAFWTKLFLCSYMMVVNRMLTPNHERFVFQLVVMIWAFFNYTPQSYRENSTQCKTVESIARDCCCSTVFHSLFLLYSHFGSIENWLFEPIFW